MENNNIVNKNIKLNPNKEYYIDSKGQVRVVKKRLLALYNEKVSYAFAYCKLKQCYMTSYNMQEKQCIMKNCKHLYLLEGNERVNGIKYAKQKTYKGGKNGKFN